MEPFDLGWTEIRQFRQRAEAEQHALVLNAMSINCRLIRQPWGIGLVVATPDAARAERELSAYAAENRPRSPPSPAYPVSQVVDGALIAAALVVLSQIGAENGFFSADWLAAGAAEAGLVRGGQWWRAFAALGLHGDLGHILSNLVFGAALGIVVAQVLGAGLAWLAILLSGALGNLVNAAFQPAGHVSIGASTAVFGALGIAAALAWQRQALGGPGLRRTAPLAAGVMLLAFMGLGGEQTDIGAHIAGFAVGAVLGFFIHQAGTAVPRGPAAQRSYAAAAAGLFVLSWLIALG